MLKIEINTSHSTSANTRILRVLADKLEGDGKSAFEDVGQDEIARILRVLADKLEGDVLAGPIYDINGTRVGKFSFDEED